MSRACAFGGGPSVRLAFRGDLGRRRVAERFFVRRAGEPGDGIIRFNEAPGVRIEDGHRIGAAFEQHAKARLAAAQRLFRDSLVHLVEVHHTAVLLVSHELGAVADDLDRVVVMKQRILFDGTPPELAATGVSLGVHADDLPRWLEELQA